MFLKKKKKLSRTIHDGAIGMASRLVGFLRQAKNRVSDYLFEAKPSRANFLTAAHSRKECETNPSREENNAAVFANRISWKKSQSLHSQKLLRWAQ